MSLEIASEILSANAVTEPKPSGDSHLYRKDIDGMRAVAILAVILFHTQPSLLRSGFIGVDIFFVISGFLITNIIVSETLAGKFTFSAFYQRRIRRIFPALILTLLFTSIGGYFILLPSTFKTLGQHTLSSVGFFQNFRLWKESGYFDSEAHFKPLLHLWSLSIEEQFYLVWPIIVFLSLRFFKRIFFPILIAISLLSFCLSWRLTETCPTCAFYSPLSRLWELSVGGLIGAGLLKFIANKNHQRSLVYVGYLFLIAGFYSIDEIKPFPGLRAVLPVVGTGLIIAWQSRSVFSEWILSNRGSVYLGKISYPLYLYHWPILSFLFIYYKGKPSPSALLCGMLFAFALATVTYETVEKFSKKKSPNSTYVRLILPSLLGLMALTGVLVKDQIIKPRIITFLHSPNQTPVDSAVPHVSGVSLPKSQILHPGAEAKGDTNPSFESVARLHVPPKVHVERAVPPVPVAPLTNSHILPGSEVVKGNTILPSAVATKLQVPNDIQTGKAVTITPETKGTPDQVLMPRDQVLQWVEEAKADTNLPSNAFAPGKKIVVSTSIKGTSNERILFIGDSHMTMYWPRIEYLMKTKGSRYSVDLANLGCPFLPNMDRIDIVQRCDEFFNASMAEAEAHDVKKVVITWRYEAYFFGTFVGEKRSSLMYEIGDDSKQPIYFDSPVLEKHIKEFFLILKRLQAKGKQITLILGSPGDHCLEPNNLVGFNGQESFLGNGGLDRKRFDDFEAPIVEKIRLYAKEANIKTIDPMDYLCEDGKCRPQMAGMLAYFDTHHLRPAFVRTHVTYLDQILER